jgi:hypothetical protein
VLRGQGAGSKIEYDFDGTTPLDGAGIAIFALNATGVTVEKLHIKGSTSVKGFNRGIYFDGGSGIRVQHNEIEGGIIGAAFGFPSAVIFTRGTTDSWITKNYIHDNGRTDRGSHGIILSSADSVGAHRVEIEGNRIIAESGDANKIHNGITVQDSTYITVVNNYIEGMTIAADLTPGGYGIQFYGFGVGRSHHHIATSNEIKDTDGTGIYLQSSPYSTVSTNVLTNTVRVQDDAGSLLVGGIGVNYGPATITGNIMHGVGVGNVSSARPAGIAIQTFDGLGGVIANGNYIENCVGTGIDFRAPTVNSNVSNNIMINTRGGISFVASTGTAYEFLTLNNNIIQQTGTPILFNASGINIRNAENTTLSSNVISRPGGHGIIAQTDTKGLVISNNVIRDASQFGAGFSGMQITGIGEHIVSGNQTNSSESPKTQTWGILENSINNTLTSNHAGGTSGGVSALGTGAVTDNNRAMP